MKVFLVILFLMPDGGLTVGGELWPIVQENMVICELRAADVVELFLQIDPHEVQVTCEKATDIYEAMVEARK